MSTLHKNAFGVHTFSEIVSQADSWEGVFKRIDDNVEKFSKLYSQAEDVVFIGCGSGFNIANAVAPFFQKVSGKTCRAVQSSDMAINPDSFLNKKRKSLVVGYSRSGDTTESVAALKKAMNAGATTITINCFAQCKMAQIADAALVLEESVEKSITTTRSLTAMVLSGYYLATVFAGNEAMCADLKKLPNIVRTKMDSFEIVGKNIAKDDQIQKYAFLGTGSFYGLAREAQLKVKEMVLLPSDSYVSLDYQHGPMSNVDENMLVTILVSDSGRSCDIELARNMKQLGGKVLVMCDKNNGDFDNSADYMVELSTNLGDGLRDILYMPTLQFMAYYKSLAVGCDPDNPKNLNYHVEIDSDIQ